eukprot:1034234-Pyramimonas_sp.AAC.1
MVNSQPRSHSADKLQAKVHDSTMYPSLRICVHREGKQGERGQSHGQRVKGRKRESSGWDIGI